MSSQTSWLHSYTHSSLAGRCVLCMGCTSTLLRPKCAQQPQALRSCQQSTFQPHLVESRCQAPTWHGAADIVADDTVARLGLGEPVAISAETGARLFTSTC